MAVSAIDRWWTYYTFTNLRLRWIFRWLTTWNVDVLESIECELVGEWWILWLTKRNVDVLRSIQYELVGVNLRDSLIFIILSDELTTRYTVLLILSTLLLLELTELQRIERLQMFLQLRTAIGGTGDEHACKGQGVLQTKDLRDKQQT